jgi:hypothetical protein
VGQCHQPHPEVTRGVGKLRVLHLQEGDPEQAEFQNSHQHGSRHSREEPGQVLRETCC